MQERPSFVERLKQANSTAIDKTKETIKSNPIAAIATTGMAGIASASFIASPQHQCNAADNCTGGTALVGFVGAGATALVATSAIYTKHFVKEVCNPTPQGLQV